MLCRALLLAALAFGASALTERRAADEIKSMPGLNYPLNFKQYSGFLKAAPNRHLHYWLVESQGDPSADPVIVWLNGGPGCSSLTGLLFENGPFHVNRDQKTLWHNPYSWNLLGSVLYIEGPTGVGFSYSDGFDDDVTDDNRAADDFYNSLDDFFRNVAPELADRPFFLSGESYAGIYIPTLTARLVDGMNSGAFPAKLDGIAIGNGLLSERQQHNSVAYLFYYRGLISSDAWAAIQRECCADDCSGRCDFFKHLHLSEDGSAWEGEDTECGRLAKIISDQLVDGTLNDAYNTYRDCYLPSVRSRERRRSMGRWLGQEALINQDSTDANAGFDCFGRDSLNAYLNIPAVQRALNIPPAVTEREGGWTWNWCSDYIEKTYVKQEREMTPSFDHIHNNSDVRILIYNGDLDTSCNFLGDEWFMSNYTETWEVPVRQWRHSWLHRGQIGGYVKRYAGMDVATVKGAGHFVPTSRPGPMLQLLANFIKDSGNYSQELTGFDL